MNTKSEKGLLVNFNKRKLQLALEKTFSPQTRSFEIGVFQFLTGYLEVSNTELLADIYSELNRPFTKESLSSYKLRYQRWAMDILDRSSAYLESLLENLVDPSLFNSFSTTEKLVVMKSWGIGGKTYSPQEVAISVGVTRQRISQIGAKVRYQVYTWALKDNRLSILEEIQKESIKYLHNSILATLPENKELLIPKFEAHSKSRISYTRWSEENRRKAQQGKEEKLRKEFLEALEALPQGDKEWLTGFWEGDGSINPRGSIGFHQKDPRILEYIRTLLGLGDLHMKHYGGNLTLYIPPLRSRLLLNTLCETLVCEKRLEQIQNVARGLELNLESTLHKPTLPWIVGFWDAEGGFSFSNRSNLIANLGQKDEEVLKKIKRVIGGRINKSSWQLFLSQKEAIKFIPIYLEYSHNPQKLEKLLTYLQGRQAKEALSKESKEALNKSQEEKYRVGWIGKELRIIEATSAYKAKEKFLEEYLKGTENTYKMKTFWRSLVRVHKLKDKRSKPLQYSENLDSIIEELEDKLLG